MPLTNRSIIVSLAVGPSGQSGSKRAGVLRCPDGIEHVIACEVFGAVDTAGDPAAFILHAAQILACQGMSAATALQTLSLGLGHYYGGAGVSASAFWAALDDGRVSYASAGHPDAFVFDAAGRHRHLSATGGLLGSARIPVYGERTLDAANGHLVVAAGGICDVRPVPAKQLAQPRFVRAASRALADGANDPAARIIASLAASGVDVGPDYALVVAPTGTNRRPDAQSGNVR